MGNKFTAFLLLTVLLCISGCGFKSDLFLPGELENTGQLNSNSIELLKQRTLDSLQGEDLEAVRSQLGGVAGNLTTADGVPIVIDPLSDEAIEEIKKNREKNNLP